VATRHFARGGYGGTSAARIAEEAGLTAGTVFYHFKSKAELYRQVGESAMEALAAELTDAGDSSADVVSALKTMFSLQIDFIRRHPDVNLASLAIDSDRRRFPAAERVVAAWAVHLDSFYRSVIGLQEGSGGANEGIDEEAVLAVIDILFRGLSHWAAKPGITAETTDAAVRGLSGLLDGTLLAEFSAATSDRMSRRA
jgi:AcrR family transcriptional regulator